MRPMQPQDNKIDELLKELNEANDRLTKEKAERRRAEAETEALIKGMRAVLQYKDFEHSARKIFDACCEITGATAGYVALLTADGSENEVLFLEAGGMPCTVDPMLPMPIRGLREVAYRTGKAVFDNDFWESPWMKFMPEGHVRLKNVMFSPLVLDKKSVGLIGVANKAGDFTQRDADLAQAFGEYAAIALHNSRSRELIEISEKKLHSVVDTAGDAIITIDCGQKIIYWNKSAENIFGFTMSEALNSDISIIIPERYKHKHTEGIKRVNYTGQSNLIGKTFEMTATRKVGGEFPVEISLAMWKVKGDPYYTAVIRDITQRKESQEQIRKSKDDLELLVQLRTKELSRAIIATQESEEKYRTVFNETILPIIIIDPETLDIKDVNEKACLFYGYPKDEFLKKRLSDINTLDDEQLRAIAGRVIDKKIDYLAARHVTASGELKDVEIYTGPITIAGKPYVCSTIYDITERKIIEQQMNLSNEILNNVEDGVVLVGASDALIKYANPKFEEIMGYGHNELLEKHVSIIYAPTDVTPEEKARQIIKVLMETDSWQGETENIRKDGAIIQCYAKASSFEHSKYATVWIFIQNDISMRLKTEQRYKTILSTSIDGFWILGMEGNILQANEAYCKMSGYTEEELTHMRIRDIEMPESPMEISRRILKVIDTGGDRFESKHRCKDGGIMDVEVSVNLLKDDDIVFAFIRDITERKALQEEIERQNLTLQQRVAEEVEKNSAKEQLMHEQVRHISMAELLVNISHHWRQPLCSVALSVQDLRDAYLHDELDERYLNDSVGLAMSELKALSETIDNFRNFYIQTKERREFNIAGEIDSAVSLILGYVKENNLVIEKELDERLMTWGYPNEFAQVILNILTNAKESFERTHHSGGVIRIKLYEDKSGRKIITIGNNGTGIADDIVHRIFDPYFTTKDKTRGAGMGLYMAKMIIEKNMNGAISAGNIDGWFELRIEL